MDFQGDSTFFNFLETQEGGFGPPEALETNPPLVSIPSPQLNFTFGGSMVANPGCLTINALAIPRPQNPLPNHPKKLFPNFDPDDDILPKTHIDEFMLAMNIMNVHHEYVACMLFCLTLQGKESSWFFNLPSRSIISWQQFENAFIIRFGDDKTSRTLLLEL